MNKKHQVSLFIFRRDLRLEDNAALNMALEESHIVVPCFIFDPRQIENNEYLSTPALHFLINSLKELSNSFNSLGVPLYFFKGTPEDTVNSLIKLLKIDAIYFNRDYTPFSRMRDQSIRLLCNQLDIKCNIYGSILLNEPEEIKKTDGKPYTVFTPYYKKASTIPVKMPTPLKGSNFYKEDLPNSSPSILMEIATQGSYLLNGGRTEGLSLLKQAQSLSDYGSTRDIPSLQETTRLSAHLKFGTISVREAFHSIKNSLGLNSPILRQFYWRDFFSHIAWHFPHVFSGAFHKKYDGILWEEKDTHFEAWCRGNTGFPVVDAGMRELNSTGFMHNRLRMITSSFLVKDLHLDWRKGEKYFARNLIDYDPSVNNGNWQWVASTGCDAQPYFRIFNPWLQQKRFDPECIYIKKWIPELSALSPKEVHNLETKRPNNLTYYPMPICDHRDAAETAKYMFSEI